MINVIGWLIVGLFSAGDVDPDKVPPKPEPKPVVNMVDL